MDTEIIDTVMKDLLEEQKKSNQLLKDLQSLVNGQTIVPPPIDTAPLQKIMTGGFDSFRTEIKAGMDKIAPAVNAQPKSIVRQYRIMFFPEADRSGNFKFFLSRTYLAVIIIIVIKVIALEVSAYIDKPRPVATAPSFTVTAAPPAFPAAGAITRPIHQRKKKNLPDTLNESQSPEKPDSTQ
jgi:hypothetical protein